MCACPYEAVENCSMNCDQIYNITVEAMNHLDENSDGQIDYTDGWTEEDM